MESTWIPSILVGKKMGVFPAKNAQGIQVESVCIAGKFHGMTLPGVHKDST
jgi:hypothetical protein